MPSILIADDEPLLLHNLERFLALRGYAVRTTPDGREAVRQLRAQPPELLLVDHNLPGQTGMEVLREASLTAPRVRVILMSGLLDKKLGEAAQRLGARACLQKPFSLHQLKEVLDRESQDPGQPSAPLFAPGANCFAGHLHQCVTA
jgi:two-component system, NtrC family, response regulator AtoC